MSKEEKKLQRPSIEKLNEYDELCKKLSDQQVSTLSATTTFSKCRIWLLRKTASGAL